MLGRYSQHKKTAGFMASVTLLRFVTSFYPLCTYRGVYGTEDRSGVTICNSVTRRAARAVFKRRNRRPPQCRPTAKSPSGGCS